MLVFVRRVQAHAKSWQDKARQGKTRQGKARQGKARQDKTKQDKTRPHRRPSLEDAPTCSNGARKRFCTLLAGPVAKARYSAAVVLPRKKRSNTKKQH